MKKFFVVLLVFSAIYMISNQKSEKLFSFLNFENDKEDSLVTNISPENTLKDIINDTDKDLYMMIFDFNCKKCLKTIEFLSSAMRKCKLKNIFISVDADDKKTEDYANEHGIKLYQVSRNPRNMRSFSNDLEALSIRFSGRVPVVTVMDENKKSLYNGTDPDTAVKLYTVLCKG